jgi:hypothetical protein
MRLIETRRFSVKKGSNKVVEHNVAPTTALKVGLKVDADVLPKGILGDS